MLRFLSSIEVRCDILQPRGQGSDQGGVSVNCQVDLLGTNQGRVEPGGLGTRGGGTFNKHRLGSQSFSKLVNITENV